MIDFPFPSRATREKRTRQAVVDLLGPHPLVGVDVGARGDIPRFWLPLDGIARIVSFDADAEACERLKAIYASRRSGDKYLVLPYALGGETGPRTLHITNVPSGTSLYDFDVRIARDYIDADYLYPMRRIQVEARSAREVFEEIGYKELHLFKLDIQGAELEVLRSLGPALIGSVLAVQLEAILQPVSPDHPTFSEVDSFMRQSGFQLFDLEPVRIHRTLNGRRSNYLEGVLGVHSRSPSVAGRVWETEALYFRAPESLEGGDEGAFRRLAVCYALYGLFTEALHTLAIASRASVITEADRLRLSSSVIDWHRCAHRRWWHGNRAPARWLRSLGRRLSFAASPVRGALGD